MFCSAESTEESEMKPPVSKVDVSYFRNLVQSETDRLTVLCAVWRSTMDASEDLSDEGTLQLITLLQYCSGSCLLVL